MRENNDEGAIVVEASIAVPVYAFIIFTILTLVNICYAQAKVQIALNSAARQFSEIAYVAYASNLADAGGYSDGKSSDMTQKISTKLNETMNEWGIQNETLSGMSEMLGKTSLTGILVNEGARATMQSLVDREFKLSKNGNSSSLVKWLNMDTEPKVHAIMTNNDVLVAGAYYEVKVIDLLNIDITYKFHSGTITYLWTNTKRSKTDIENE
ncbi:MAG: pilus assembly protein [Coprococcus eutactus]|nr:pilus assembly protein [Coprococcus eutactus]